MKKRVRITVGALVGVIVVGKVETGIEVGAM